MQAIVAELAAEHAREAALLWELWHAEPGDEELHERINAHLDGLLVACEHGVDPLAGLEKPWSGADWFPVAWLGVARSSEVDEVGEAAVADARHWQAAEVARASRPGAGEPTHMGEDAQATDPQP